MCSGISIDAKSADGLGWSGTRLPPLSDLPRHRRREVLELTVYCATRPGLTVPEDEVGPAASRAPDRWNQRYSLRTYYQPPCGAGRFVEVNHKDLAAPTRAEKDGGSQSAAFYDDKGLRIRACQGSRFILRCHRRYTSEDAGWFGVSISRPVVSCSSHSVFPSGWKVRQSIAPQT